jgi:uncharacterized membrane protein
VKNRTLVGEDPLSLLPSMTTTSTASMRMRSQKRPLTNTNTDEMCKNDTLLNKWIYRFYLWTGLYMLNPYERFIFLVVGFFSLTVSMLYLYVFAQGVVEGFRKGETIMA